MLIVLQINKIDEKKENIEEVKSNEKSKQNQGPKRVEKKIEKVEILEKNQSGKTTSISNGNQKDAIALKNESQKSVNLKEVPQDKEAKELIQVDKSGSQGVTRGTIQLNAKNSQPEVKQAPFKQVPESKNVKSTQETQSSKSKLILMDSNVSQKQDIKSNVTNQKYVTSEKPNQQEIKPLDQSNKTKLIANKQENKSLNKKEDISYASVSKNEDIKKYF